MERLIDAGLFLDSLSGRLENIKDYDAVKDVINNMSIAYDPDKVAEELERKKFIEQETILSDIHQGFNAGLSTAIQIVKGGGVDGD